MKKSEAELLIRAAALKRAPAITPVAPTTGALSTLVALAKGDVGERGEAGPTGPQGTEGARGELGAQGLVGVEGARGELGSAGPAGIDGPKGDRGEKGIKGDKGLKGDKGDTGPQGPAGSSSSGGYTGMGGGFGPSQASAITVAAPLTGTVQSVLQALSSATSGPTTTAGLPDSTDRRYVTDAQRTVIAVTSGVNTGDQVNLVGANGGTAGDVITKIGASLPSASITATSRLLSVRTGIGTGSEIEKVYIDVFGDIRQAAGSKYRGGSANSGVVSVDDSVGVTLAYGGNTLSLDGAESRFGGSTFNMLRINGVSGELKLAGADTSGTAGAASSNKPSGVAAIASAATTVTISNANATAGSHVLITWLGDHGAARSWVTRAAGTFTVNLSAAASANTSFAWELKTML